LIWQTIAQLVKTLYKGLIPHSALLLGENILLF